MEGADGKGRDMAEVTGIRQWWRGGERHPSSRGGAPTALVLPGMGYSAEYPLLFWASTALVQAHWNVFVVDWDTSDLDLPADIDEGRDFVERAFERACDALDAPAPDLLIGKSLGALAATPALESGSAVVALTPVLAGPAPAHYPVCDTGRVLAVGGTADALWDAARARRLGWEVLEVEGGDHSLQVRGDWRTSLRVVDTVTSAVADFARGLAPRPID